MTALHLDLETRIGVDLRKTGGYIYAESPTTDVWCAAYCVDDGPVELWVPELWHDEQAYMPEGYVDCPDEIRNAVRENWQIVAHNANFERALWAGVLAPRYGWPTPRLEQWRCTMAMALAMALPPALGQCAEALGLTERKDDDGKALMLRMAKPRKVNADGSFTWWTVP